MIKDIGNQKCLIHIIRKDIALIENEFYDKITSDFKNYATDLGYKFRMYLHRNSGTIFIYNLNTDYDKDKFEEDVIRFFNNHIKFRVPNGIRDLHPFIEDYIYVDYLLDFSDRNVKVCKEEEENE